MSMMHALRAHERGGPEVLVFEDAPRPVPGDEDVLVQVYAAAITFTELGWDQTWTRDGVPRTPIIPSHEASGRVVAVGGSVQDVSVGDEVFGLVPFDRDGAAAEYVALPAANVALRPMTVDLAESSVLPLAALTAYQAIVQHGGVAGGDRVLIQGAAGGVGLLAVQLAVVHGSTVVATGRPEDRDLVMDAGASAFVDFLSQPLSDAGSGFDLVLYAVPGMPAEESYAALRPGGRLVCLNAPPDAEISARYGVEGVFFVVSPDRSQMEAVARLVGEGTVRVLVSAVYPLADGRRAFESGQDPDRPPGKTVLAVDESRVGVTAR